MSAQHPRYINDLVPLLLERAPNLRRYVPAEWDDIPYVFFGSVSQYLQEDAADDQTVKDIFAFIRELATREDALIDDLLRSGFFENLYDSDEGKTLAHSSLSGRSLELFRQASPKNIG